MTAERRKLLIQLLLKEFPQGLKKKDISQFLRESTADVSGLLQEMREAQLVEYNDITFRWSLLRHPLVHERLTPEDSEGDTPTAERGLLLLAGGEKLAACSQLHAYLQVLITEPAIHGVSVCLDILIGNLRECAYAQMDDSTLRHYLDLLLNVQGDSFSFGVRMRLAHTLSSVANAVADMLGDERAQALINIMDGCLRYHSGREDYRGMNKLLDDSLAAIRELGDIDIETQLKYFLSFLYYEKGDYRACYAAFDDAQGHLHVSSCQYFNMLYPIYMAPAANRIGQYAQSIGICTGPLREARRNNDKYKELWLTVILAVQFLQLGASAQGLNLLSNILDCVDAEASPKLYLWAWRALALFHAKSGRAADSHRILTDCIQGRFRQGLGRFAFTAEWILEMLEDYRKKKLPPVPGYELEQEVERVLAKQDRHLHGMAFKIKALLLPKENLDERILLLQSSCEAFEECGNRREAARSTLLLAQQYRRAGLPQKAEDLRKNAREVLLETTLRPVRSNARLVPWPGLIYATKVQKSLERCFAHIDKIDLKLSAEAYTAQLLNAVQRELGAESAALCRLRRDGSLAYVAGCNTSAQEYEHWHVTEYMHALNLADRQEWTLSPSHESVLFCMRIDCTQKPPLFLFLESSYIAGAFVSMSPDDIRALQTVLRRELDSLIRLEKSGQEKQKSLSKIEYVIPASDRLECDDSPGYLRILEQAKHAAQTDAPILILGETGVGKEVLAHQIHKFSGRPGMFVPVHPASTPENLFESEFFGYEKGAFTGAHKQKVGFFELADNGTFFIDELAEIPMSFQVKLLRVLQDHSFTRVGGIRYITSNFRLVAATNKNLWQEVQEGRFREDLYYRLSVIPITLPPLRQRQQDIPRLLNLFFQQFSTRYGRKLPPISDELIEQCKNYSWPGNIREMRNIVERAVILHTGGPLKLFLSSQDENPPSSAEKQDCSSLYSDLPTLEELSLRYMRYVLEKTKGKIIGPDGAESILGVKRSTLYAKLKKYDLR